MDFLFPGQPDAIVRRWGISGAACTFTARRPAGRPTGSPPAATAFPDPPPYARRTRQSLPRGGDGPADCAHGILATAAAFDTGAATAALDGLDNVEVVQAEESGLILAVGDGPRMLSAVLAALAAAGCEVRESTMTQPSRPA